MIWTVLFSFLSMALAQDLPEAKPDDIKSDFTQEKIAESDHLPVRKIVVFPFEVAPRDADAGEKAWWKVREELTANKRFLIASKQLMVRKDVMTPKKEIDRASAVLLGKHLDAEALVTGSVKDRELKMSVYSALTGSLLWTQKLALTTAQPVSEQLESASVKLIRDYVASIPYQGFLIVDPLIARPIFDEGSVRKAKVEVGIDARVERGDPVQWIQVRENAPVYQSLSNLLVVAEGNVIEIDRGIITVEIKRLKDPRLIVEKSLVRLPKEAIRLAETMSLKPKGSGISPEIIVAEMRAAQPDIQKHKGFVATGATLGSILAFILLAF
jgi:hypothetical protein